MVKNLELEQNPFASNKSDIDTSLEAEARRAEVAMSNPLMNYTPSFVQPMTQPKDFMDQDPATQNFILAQLPGNNLVPVPVIPEEVSFWGEFGKKIVGSAIETGGLALQGLSESIAAGTATDDDYKNVFENFFSGKDSTLWRAGQALREGQREIFGEVEMGGDNFAELGDDLGSALGSVIPSIAAGYAGAVPGAAIGASIGSVVPIIGTGIGGVVGGAVGFFTGASLFGAGALSGEMAERARDLGFDEYDLEFKKAIGASFGLGTSEAVPAGAIAGKIGLTKYLGTNALGAALYQSTKKIPGVNIAVKAAEKLNPKARRIIGDMFIGLTAGAVAEGGQEYAQAVGQDYIEQLYLNPEATIQWSANTYDGALGGFAGGVLGTIVFPFAKAKTRRIARLKKEEEALRAATGEVAEDLKPQSGFRTVLSAEDYFGGEVEIDEVTDPFGFDTSVDDTPGDDTGPDYNPKDVEIIDVWSHKGGKKKAKVIQRDEETGAVRFEVDGQEYINGFEFDTVDPTGNEFTLSALDGEGTRINPKDLSDSQIQSLLEDRRQRVRALKGQEGMGAYYTYMREGIALRTEAERRGIYKKPTATETQTETKVEEKIEPVDIANSASAFFEQGDNLLEPYNRPTVQRALAANKDEKTQERVRNKIKDSRRSRLGKPFKFTEDTVSIGDRRTANLADGKIAFITKAQAEKIIAQGKIKPRTKTLFDDTDTTRIVLGGRDIPLEGRFTMDALMNKIRVGTRDGKQTLILDNDDSAAAITALQEAVNQGMNVIPIKLAPEFKITERKYSSLINETWQKASFSRDQEYLQEGRDDIVDIFLPDGSQLIYDKASWSNVQKQEKEKARTADGEEEEKTIKVPKESTPLYGPFGNDLNGKRIGTDNVPQFALDYADQILNDLNMPYINIFFYSDGDTNSDGSIKESVVRKHNLGKTINKRAFTTQWLKDNDVTRMDVLSDPLLRAKLTNDYREAKRYSLARGMDSAYGFVNQFGPDALENHTYYVYLNTKATRQRRSAFPIFRGKENVALNRSAEDVSLLTTVAHEVGHTLEWELFNNAKAQEQIAVLKDYYEYLGKGNKRQNLSWNKSNIKYKLDDLFTSEKKISRNDYLFADGTIDINKLIADLKNEELFTNQRDMGKGKYGANYMMSFPEWFAEQTSRWALTNVRPKTLSEKFFAKVAAIWNSIFDTTPASPGIQQLFNNRSENKLWVQEQPFQKIPAADRATQNTPRINFETKSFNPIIDGEGLLKRRFGDDYIHANDPLVEDGVDAKTPIETELEMGATIDEILEDPSVKPLADASLDATTEAVEPKATIEEETATIAEPIVASSEGTESSEGTRKKPTWKPSLFKWVQGPLDLFSIRDTEGNFVFPEVRKVIRKFQFNQQTVTAKLGNILKRYREKVAPVKKSGEMGDVSAVIIQGDLEQKKYTNAELANGIKVDTGEGTSRVIKLSEEGRKAYKGTRDMLDELADMINAHNAMMKPKTRVRFNALMSEAKELFYNAELNKKTLIKKQKVEFVPIKDDKSRRVQGYKVFMEGKERYTVMMSDFPAAKNGKQLQHLIRDSKRFKDAQEALAENANIAFKLARKEVKFEELYEQRETLYYQIKQQYRAAFPNEAMINSNFEAIRAIEKEIGYTKRNTELDQKIVEMDIERSRIKPDMDIKTNKGYLPHMWFGSHSLVMMIPTADGKVKRVAKFSEQGYFNSEAEAKQFGENLIKANPEYADAVIEITNRGTTWAEEGFSSRTIDDSIYDELAKLLTADDLNNIKTGRQSMRALLVSKGLTKEKRRAEASFEKERLGAEGYSTDTERVVESHLHNVMRYLIMDEMKYNAFEIQQQLDAERSPYAEDFRTYVEAIENVEGGFENAFDRVYGTFADGVDSKIEKITSGKVKGLDRAYFTAGLTGILTASTVGIFGAPVVGTVLGGAFGVLVYKRVKQSLESGRVSADGDAKIFDPMIQATLGVSAHAKLGMFFNLLSPIVNLSQTVINTASLYNYNEVGQSLSITRRYVAGKISGTDTEFVEMWEARFEEGGVDIDQGLFTDAQELNLSRGWIERNSMFLFQKAEVFNRMVAYGAGFVRAQNAGKSESQARLAGQEAWNKTQFFYDKTDTSRLLRIKGLKVGTQFKNFLFKQTAFSLGIGKSAFLDTKPLEKEDGTMETLTEAADRVRDMRIVVIKQLLHVFALAGALGVPGLQALDWLIRLLTSAMGDEYSPILELQRLNLDLHAKGEAYGIAANVLIKGLPTLIGQDISARVGLGNRFIPYNDRLSAGENLMDQFKGPWISTLINSKKLTASGATLGDQLVNISSGVGKPLKAIEMLAGGQDLRSAFYGMGPGKYSELVLHGLFNPSSIELTSGYKKGQTVSKDVSLLDVINYAIGGRPIGFSNESDLNAILMFDDRIADKNVTKVYTKMARAFKTYAKTDPEKFRQTMNELAQDAFDKGTPINFATIKRMFQTLNTPRAMNQLKRMRKVARPEYYKYIEGYTL